jgi:hypothetical protein
MIARKWADSTGPQDGKIDAALAPNWGLEGETSDADK